MVIVTPFPSVVERICDVNVRVKCVTIQDDFENLFLSLGGRGVFNGGQHRGHLPPAAKFKKIIYSGVQIFFWGVNLFFLYTLFNNFFRLGTVLSNFEGLSPSSLRVAPLCVMDLRVWKNLRLRQHFTLTRHWRIQRFFWKYLCATRKIHIPAKIVFYGISKCI